MTHDLRDISPCSTNFTTYLEEDLTYVTDLFPTLRKHERTGKYYSIQVDKMPKYYYHRHEAQQEHEYVVLVLKQRQEQSRQALQEVAQHTQHGTSQRGWKYHGQQSRAIVNLQRATNILDDSIAYGVQEHDTPHQIYTVEYPAALLSILPKQLIFEDHEFLDPAVFRLLCQRIGRELTILDQSYRKLFGYRTLLDAVEHEEYLKTLLAHTTLREIAAIHEEYFATFQAKTVTKAYMWHQVVVESVQQSMTPPRSILDGKVPYIPEVQRQMMRLIYGQSVVMDHIATSPLSWLAEMIDTSSIDGIMWNFLKSTYDEKTIQLAHVDFGSIVP